MTDRKLTVSLGGGSNLAAIQETRELTWPEFAAMLIREPPELEDKKDAGWYCAGLFKPEYRDNENLVHRDCLTLDYDHITPADVKTIQGALKAYEYVVYTTWQHVAEKPRIRVVVPLDRPATPDEFCAVSRRISERAGIELAARESYVPAQCMFLPSRRPSTKFRGVRHEGTWVNVDEILSTYVDWTDKTSWPHRSDGDSTHHAATAERPEDKDGIVGLWCRTFNCEQAIERFSLPYVRVR